MSNLVIMTRINEFEALNICKKYTCPIPLAIIKEIALIEKMEWKKFCFPPYSGLGKFIALHLDHYPNLKPYISLNTKAFDFTYQYICDCSMLIESTYIFDNIEITETEYQEFYLNYYYFEQWSIFDPHTNKTLIFFEYENLPSKYHYR